MKTIILKLVISLLYKLAIDGLVQIKIAMIRRQMPDLVIEAIGMLVDTAEGRGGITGEQKAEWVRRTLPKAVPASDLKGIPANLINQALEVVVEWVNQGKSGQSILRTNGFLWAD